MRRLTKAGAILSGLLLVFGAAPASAGLITLDPDSFADGTILNNILPGLTLSAIRGSDGASGNVTAATNAATASTGTMVFGGAFAAGGDQWGDGFWDYMRVDLSVVALSVSLDFIGTDPVDQNPVLAAYDAGGNLITSVTAPGSFSTGQFVTLTVAGAGIATVAALGDPGAISIGTLAGLNVGSGGAHSWAFDNLQVQPVPEPGTMALLGVGLAGLVAGRRRKRS